MAYGDVVKFELEKDVERVVYQGVHVAEVVLVPKTKDKVTVRVRTQAKGPLATHDYELVVGGDANDANSIVVAGKTVSIYGPEGTRVTAYVRVQPLDDGVKKLGQTIDYYSIIQGESIYFGLQPAVVFVDPNSADHSLLVDFRFNVQDAEP